METSVLKDFLRTVLPSEPSSAEAGAAVTPGSVSGQAVTGRQGGPAFTGPAHSIEGWEPRSVRV